VGNQAAPIMYDFASGQVEGGSLSERIGIMLMRIAAKITGYRQFYGFSHLSKMIRFVFPGKNLIQTNMAKDFIFCFPYGDAYWGRLLDNSQKYEADVEALLRLVIDTDYAFIDCGANYGYMSALASSPGLGSKPAIAIEADHESYEILVHNAKINAGRFEPRHNAIYSKSGNTVQIFGDKHESRSIHSDDGQARGDTQTLAIDDLKPWIERNKKKHVVIKLDVEGAEIDAVKGAKNVIKGDCMIVYEDHGSDRDHEVSRFLKDQCLMKIFHFDGEIMQEVVDYGTLDAIKKNPRYGYDLIATKSPFWLEKLSMHIDTNLTAGA